MQCVGALLRVLCALVLVFADLRCGFAPVWFCSALRCEWVDSVVRKRLCFVGSWCLVGALDGCYKQLVWRYGFYACSL